MKAEGREKGELGFKGDLVSLILPFHSSWFLGSDQPMASFFDCRDLQDLQENKDLRDVEGLSVLRDMKDQQDQLGQLDPTWVKSEMSPCCYNNCSNIGGSLSALVGSWRHHGGAGETGNRGTKSEFYFVVIFPSLCYCLKYFTFVLFTGQSRARWCSRRAWASRQQGGVIKQTMLLIIEEKQYWMASKRQGCTINCRWKQNERINVSFPRVEKVKQDILGCQVQW